MFYITLMSCIFYNFKFFYHFQIITAYLTDSGVVLGQEKINEKTNEIPVLRQMLEYMNIKGKTITADALHCQKETCY